ncbi:hypothetical protein VTL71DRAFT_14049 [Oculimacula yallundae]
MPIFS